MEVKCRVCGMPMWIGDKQQFHIFLADARQCFAVVADIRRPR